MDFSDRALDMMRQLSTTEMLKGFLEGYALAKSENGKEEAFVLTPTPAPVITSPPAPQPAPSAEPKRLNGYIMKNRGLRANILRLMFTGPVRQQDLLAQLGSDKRAAVRHMLQSLTHTEMVAWDRNHDLATLTVKGREEANWFVRNPGIRLRHPSSKPETKGG